MGIPDEPFWSPPEVVAAYREETATRWAADHERWEHTLDGLDTDGRAAWDAAWGATGIAGWEDRLPTFAAGEKVATRSRDGQDGRVGGRRLPGPGVRCRRPHRQHGHQAARGDAAADRRDPGRSPAVLRGPRARHGRGDGRDGPSRRDPADGRDVLRVPRLHASAGAAGRALPGQGRVRVVARLGRSRRGRPDAPAGRAPRHAARHPRAAGDPAGRRQRDGGGVEGGRRPRRPDGARAVAPGHRRCTPTVRPSSAAPASCGRPTVRLPS